MDIGTIYRCIYSFSYPPLSTSKFRPAELMSALVDFRVQAL